MAYSIAYFIGSHDAGTLDLAISLVTLLFTGGVAAMQSGNVLSHITVQSNQHS